MGREKLIQIAKKFSNEGLPDKYWLNRSINDNGKISLPLDAERLLGVGAGSHIYFLVYKNLPGNEGLPGAVIVRNDVLHKYIYNNAESFILSLNSKNKDTPDYTSKTTIGTDRQLSMPKEVEEVQINRDSKLDLLGFDALADKSGLSGIVVVNSSVFENYIWNIVLPHKVESPIKRWFIEKCCGK